MAHISKVCSDHAAAPLAVTVSKACTLSGFRPTSIWKFLKDGRLHAIRVPGVRRTLVSYESLRRLLTLPSAQGQQPRRRGRPRKSPALVEPERCTP
jgi:hypothetical protein